MPSSLLIVAVVLLLAAHRVARRHPPEPTDRRWSPSPYPIRRLRSDSPDTLFLDSPDFRRRVMGGWGTNDRDRVPR